MNVLGAIIGDICGSTYEWNNETDINKIELFKKGSRFTDDTVLTIAVMDWLVQTGGSGDKSMEVLIKCLQKWANKYPKAGYGGMFRKWLTTDGNEPINSFGNGSAMRVSACGFAANSIEEAMDLAKKSAEVTHNHPEGVKGAQAVAVAIYLARTGCNMEEIRKNIGTRFGYDLHTPVEERPKHKFDATCQVTVPEAFMAFFNNIDYEQTIIEAIAIGGDSDTIAAIAGSIAGAYYGVPSYLTEKAIEILPTEMFNVISTFNNYYHIACLAKKTFGVSK